MAVKAVVFDVGETLVDETGMWERAADAAGVPRFTLMGVLGGLAARGETHSKAWEILAVEWPASTWTADEFYPDALPCLSRLRSGGLLVGAAGNMPAETEELVREHVDIVGSTGRWGIEKPLPEFFGRIAAEAGFAAEEIAYVGDRVDNDVRAARAAGMVAVHIRRGPWGHLQRGAEEAHLRIDSLAELPEVLDGV
ncbi:MAG TPA: HAD family hydrolase [Gaiellaceae bacterium]|nr:HAD family hydrolase [Gaiellaceae bacterium]